MKLFCDTSGLYAVLDQDDDNHRRAAPAWFGMLDSAESLITSNYVVIETVALLQHRIGMNAVRAFQSELLPALHTVFVDENLHRRGMAALWTAGRRRVSLVDCVSFAMMLHLGLTDAFAFDEHFRQQGFATVP